MVVSLHYGEDVFDMPFFYTIMTARFCRWEQLDPDNTELTGDQIYVQYNCSLTD